MAPLSLVWPKTYYKTQITTLQGNSSPKKISTNPSKWVLNSKEMETIEAKREKFPSVYHLCVWKKLCFRTKSLHDMLGGSVVKNPPASVGDTGLTPDLGRSHMPWCTYVNYARAPQPLSLCSRVQEPRLLRPHATTISLCSTTREATAMRSLCTATTERPPLAN